MAKGSLGKKNQGKAGSLYEGPIRISNARFGKTDFGGKAAETVALLFTGEHLDQNDDITTAEFIMGVGKHWTPSEDGVTPAEEGGYIVTEKDGLEGLNDQTGAAKFLSSLEDTRGSELDSADDLNGLMVAIKRVPAPTDQKPDRKVYVVTEMLDEVPWDTKKSSKVAKPQFNTTATDSESALKVLAAAVEAAGKRGVRKADIGKAAADAITNWGDAKEKKALVAQRTAIIDMLTDDDFLSENAGDVYNYDSDSGKVTAAA